MSRAWRTTMGCLLVVGIPAGCSPLNYGAPASIAQVADIDQSDAVTDQDTIASRLEPGVLRTVHSAPVLLESDSLRRPFEVALRTEELASGHARRFGTITMRVALRTRSPDLSQYPCTSCHLGLRVVMADDRIGDAHQNIQPVHPKATGAVCSTCHAAENVERLVVRTNERPTLDHSYQLCAKCHFSQAEAWAGGGHGKRLDGWQGRRVVMGCTDCHDPHSPGLVPRVPFRGPTLAPRRGHE
ncbi:MAG: hypothetical protein AAB075_01700 [Gemmatimonadota bacterium]